MNGLLRFARNDDEGACTGAWRFPRLILHAIAVLGGKDKPASPVAPLRCAILDSCARRRRWCYHDVLLTKPAVGRFDQQNVLIANKPRRPIAVTRQGRSEAEDPP
jgi:hypothetical protein